MRDFERIEKLSGDMDRLQIAIFNEVKTLFEEANFTTSTILRTIYLVQGQSLANILEESLGVKREKIPK